MSIDELAQALYEAYCQAQQEALRYPLPSWERCSPVVQEVWRDMAAFVEDREQDAVWSAVSWALAEEREE